MPGARCAVAVCNNNFGDAKKKGLDISFHSFPKTDELAKLWIEQCRRKDQFNTKSSVVCSNHFEKEDFELSFHRELLGISKKRILKKTAIPSLNLDSELKPAEQGTNGMVSTKTETWEVQENKQICDNLIHTPTASTPIEYPDKILPENTLLFKSPAPEESMEIQEKKPIIDDLIYSQIENPEDSVEVKYQKLLIEHQSLKRKYEDVLQSRSNLKRKTNRLTKEAASAMTRLRIEQKARQSLQSILNKSFSRAQIQLLSNARKRVQWSDEDISKAFSIRYMSKRCYVHLRETLHYPLPHVDTLKKWMYKAKV